MLDVAPSPSHVKTFWSDLSRRSESSENFAPLRGGEGERKEFGTNFLRRTFLTSFTSSFKRGLSPPLLLFSLSFLRLPQFSLRRWRTNRLNQSIFDKPRTCLASCSWGGGEKSHRFKNSFCWSCFLFHFYAAFFLRPQFGRN